MGGADCWAQAYIIQSYTGSSSLRFSLPNKNQQQQQKKNSFESAAHAPSHARQGLREDALPLLFSVSDYSLTVQLYTHTHAQRSM